VDREPALAALLRAANLGRHEQERSAVAARARAPPDFDSAYAHALRIG
jgi:hypothetical protein